MADTVGFFRKNGKIIPIHKVAGGAAKSAISTGARAGYRAGHIAGRATQYGLGAYAIHQAVKKKPQIKVNSGLDALGVGLSALSGAIGAATFAGGTKSFVAGAAAGHAIDIAGVAANAASVAGQGDKKGRAKQFARQEGRNFLIGNGVFAAGLIGMKRNREALAEGSKKAVAVTQKIIAFTRKALVRV